MYKTYIIALTLFTMMINISCKSEVASYPEMHDLYFESCNLKNVSKDSVDMFNSKFKVFIEKNPAAVKDTLYPYILENTFTATKYFNDIKKDSWEIFLR